MRPNIVQITCHDLGRHLGCYGLSTVQSPHLDGLAAQGVRLRDFFCTAPGCSPSRASLATGRYPHQNGVMGLAHDHFGWELHPTEQPVGRLLHNAGYRTALFGLQHVTYHIEHLGFDEVFPERPALDLANNFLPWTPPGEGPWYVEINHLEPHRPFSWGHIPEDTSRGLTVPAWLDPDPLIEQEFAELQGAIRYMDDQLGRILRRLDDMGWRDNTLVVFTPDHGLPFPFAKGTLYDPGIEIAAIARWPAGGVASGRVVEGLWSNIDILPTLLEAAGLAAPAAVAGRSLLGALRGDPVPARDAIFAEKTYHEEYDPIRCVRTPTHKLIVNFEIGHVAEVPGDIMQGGSYAAVLPRLVPPRPVLEVYDLTTDPTERNNLAALSSSRDVLESLRQPLLAWMQETNDPLLAGPIPSPVYRKALQTLYRPPSRPHI